MIAQLQGILDEIEGTTAYIRTDGGLTYEVLLPTYAAARLSDSLGQVVRLHTMYFIEGQMQGSTLTPRLAGFLTKEDRRFFELFTTAKGIGNRRALRAMALETGQIAAAIADRDLAMLQSLPEIGRRTAETLVATLHGKVDKYLSVVSVGDAGKAAAGAGAGKSAGGRTLAREALEVLLQLGENRVQALAWIDQALRDEKDRPHDVQDLIARVYRIKAGA